MRGVGICRLLIGTIVAGLISLPSPRAETSPAGRSDAANTGAIRVFALLKRRSDIDVAAFSLHWRTRHAEAAMKLTGYFDRYVQNHFPLEVYPGFSRTFDGGAELWYASLQRSIDLGESEEYKSDAMQDNYRFQDVDAMRLFKTKVVQTSENLERPAPKGSVKAIALWKRKAGTDAEAFRARFIEASRPLLLPEGHFSAFERGVAIARDETEPVFDAYEQLWWAREADYAKDAATLGTQRFADSDLVDAGFSMALRVNEIYIYWPPQITKSRGVLRGPDARWP